VQITKIEQQKKNASRYSIYVDGEFAVGVHESIFFGANLHVRDEITPEQIADFEKQDAVLRAKESAFHLLKFRQRSEAELRFRLAQKEFDSAAVEQVIDEFCTKGYLNDEKFAREFAEDQLIRKNIGPLRLRSELTKKQVPKPVIENVIAEIYEKYDPYELAEQAADKKLAKEKTGDYEMVYRRVSNYLARRGFTWEIISDILDKKLKR
jgi:regulatory protein